VFRSKPKAKFTEMLSTVIRRWSHVGRQPITVEPNVAVQIIPQKGTGQIAFGRTAVSNIVRVTGPLGSLDFPIHRGLKVSLEAGVISDENVLKVTVDDMEFSKMSKYCKKFVKAMWGTTTSTLRQYVEGVNEVSGVTAHRTHND
jgi:ribosomal protein L6P/L9E